MLLYGVAFGVFAHLLFWGAGLAMLAMPRPWRRCWPILAFPAGLALQSLAVWIGAYAGFRGTDRYAWAAEAAPLALLAIGLWRGRAATRLSAWGGLAAVSGAVLAALLCPLARAAKGLTTASLGSCDAADYAAGARVLQQFAHGDRGGFLGLTAVVRIQSVDNFFDFWLRLNHFTPSALIAFAGSIFHCQPHELTGLFAAVVLAGSVPLVFWMARALLRYRGGASLLVAAFYGFSPITWYAVYQVAIGQLIAALGLGLLTWAGVALWRGPLTVRRGAGMVPVLTLAFMLLLGAYNFIVLVSLASAGAYVLACAVSDGRLQRIGPWLAWMLAAFVLAGVIFWARVAGLLERFRLFRTYDFGWKIPGLSPEAWLGLVRAPGLDPLASGQRRFWLALWMLLTTAALARGWRRGWKSPWLAVWLSLPILAGYVFLLQRGARLGTNASYDAYKLFAVFFPVLLPAALFWVTLFRSRWFGRLAAWVMVLAAGFATGSADRAFGAVMSAAPLIVDRDLIAVRQVERLPEVSSLNMRVPRMWERLWANALLLQRPQYFPTHTYEGRLNTPLAGTWDLNGGLIAVALGPEDSRTLSPHYSIVRVGSAAYCRASLGLPGESTELSNPAGWYPEERLPRTTQTWRWTGEEAWITLDNPHPYPLRVTPVWDVSSLRPRELQLWSGARELATGTVSPERARVRLGAITLPPGISAWAIRADPPAERPGPGDTRRLAFQVFGLELDVAAAAKAD